MDHPVMKRSVSVLLFVVQALLAAEAHADDIRYLAWNEQQGRATIETSAGVQSVGLGDAVPGFGNVIAVDEIRLVVRRVLSHAERDRLAERGLTDYTAERVEVVREDLALQRVSIP